MQTNHKPLLSILKERSSKTHQSRLTRWYDRLIPFNFNIEQIAGTKMRLADYMSRNPSEPAKLPSEYDENFIIAQIDIIKETLQIIRKRGRPKKQNNNKTAYKTKTTHNESNDTQRNIFESSNDSNNFPNNQIKRQRGRPRKAGVESSNDSTQTKITITNNPQNNKIYNLRSGHETIQAQLNITNNDVTYARHQAQDTQQTNAQAQMAINTAITQQRNPNKQHNFTTQIDNTNSNSYSANAKSPEQKTPFSMSNYLSPTPKSSPSHRTINSQNNWKAYSASN